MAISHYQVRGSRYGLTINRYKYNGMIYSGVPEDAANCEAR